MTDFFMLGDADLHRFAMAIWGYAIAGRVLEFSALVSERSQLEDVIRAWDGDRHTLETIGIFDRGAKLPTPERYALPWVTEHVMSESLRSKFEETRKR